MSSQGKRELSLQNFLFELIAWLQQQWPNGVHCSHSQHAVELTDVWHVIWGIWSYWCLRCWNCLASEGIRRFMRRNVYFPAPFWPWEPRLDISKEIRQLNTGNSNSENCFNYIPYLCWKMRVKGFSFCKPFIVKLVGQQAQSNRSSLQLFIIISFCVTANKLSHSDTLGKNIFFILY